MYAVSVSNRHFSWTHSAWDPTEPIATRRSLPNEARVTNSFTPAMAIRMCLSSSTLNNVMALQYTTTTPPSVLSPVPSPLDKDELISRVEKSLLKFCPIYEAKDTHVPLLVAIQAVERCFDLPIEDGLLSWL